MYKLNLLLNKMLHVFR